MKFSIVALSVATVFIQSACAAPASISEAPVAEMTSVPPVPSATPSASVSSVAPPAPTPLSAEEQEELEYDLQGMEDQAVLEDMVQNGWPRHEAEMVLGLFDAVDTMTGDLDHPEEEFETVDSLRDGMSQWLSRVGYEYDQVSPNSNKVFSRVMVPASAEAANPMPYSPQSMLEVVHGLVNLAKSATKLGPFLGNPALAQYGKLITSAADMIESAVRTAKSLIAPRV
ncbi:hypothetical protein BC941DRAFT_466169 [Chlamydoabsidia padenii]|nr:hypothetical protein BC941DRAFT_466169 [Chlamydoabsidia padenii]